MKGLSLIKSGEIHLFGTIVKDEWIWPEDTGYFSSIMLIDALAQFEGDVVLRVNSDGGNPVEGEAMRAAIENHPGKVTVKIQGACHSAASLMVMAADHIEMSAGSTMLIHDPSTYAGGNPAQLEEVVAELTVMANTYAAVYAARAKMTEKAARDIMKKGVTLSPARAVELGFADAVAETEQMSGEATVSPELHLAAMQAATSAYNVAHSAQMKFEAADGDAVQQNDGGEAAETGQNNGQSKEDLSMPKLKNTPLSAPTPAETPAMTAKEAVAAERQRAKEIRAAAAPFMVHLVEEDVAAMVDDGLTLDQAREKIMNKVAAAQPAVSNVTITRDETETKTEAMISALMHKADPRHHKLEGAAMEYRGMRIKGLAMHLAGSARGFNDHDTIRAGLRSTSMMGGAAGVGDFAYITGEVMNRTLQAAFKRRAQTFRMISRQRTAADFRELHSIRVGGDLALKTIGENGEYQRGTITDEAEGLKLGKYGRDIAITFEAIVNDDMGAFERLPLEFAIAAATLESKIAWAIIRENQKLKSDDKALFHADHGNTATAAAISAASVGAGRKAMFEQRPAGSKDKDDFIEVEPDLLFVPPALELKAGQFVSEITPAKTDDANPFRSTLQPVVETRLGAAAGGSDANWYLFSSDMPVLEHAYLDGYEAPTIMTKEGMNPDGVNLVARHIFAAAAVEFRGAYRNGS